MEMPQNLPIRFSGRRWVHLPPAQAGRRRVSQPTHGLVQHPPPTPSLFASAGARRMAWLCGSALALACLALNRRVLDFGFLYLRDDDVNVTLNPHMGGIDLARLKWMFTDWSYVRRYIPLGWLNFSATYEFAGLDPRPYHAVALGLYVLNTGLVFALVLHALRLFVPRSEEHTSELQS